MDEYNIFVRINYSDLEKSQAAVGRTRVNNNEVKATKYLIGGGVYNRKGGTVIFTAKSLEEVKQVTKDGTLLKNLSMNYNVGVIPKGI